MTACGKAHSLFLSKEGRLFACGFNEYGELGVASEIGDDATGEGEAAIMLKCKNTPFQVNTTKKMRYIAAAGNHSLAISTEYDKGHAKSDVYTWGSSASGQLGHYKVKNTYNITKPKKVKFLDNPETKIVFAAASFKHTLCVDDQGAIWYFGEKQSVGVHDKNEKLQFEPKKLVPQNKEYMTEQDLDYRYIAAGPNNNMAISMRNGNIFNFGLNVLNAQRTAGLAGPADESSSDGESSDSGDPIDLLDLGGNEKSDEAYFMEQTFAEKEEDQEAYHVSVGTYHQVAIQKCT